MAMGLESTSSSVPSGVRHIVFSHVYSPPPRGPNLEPRGEDGAPRHPPPPPPSGGDEGGGGKDISSGGYKTAQQVAGEAVLQRVMEDVEGVSFSFQ